MTFLYQVGRKKKKKERNNNFLLIIVIPLLYQKYFFSQYSKFYYNNNIELTNEYYNRGTIVIVLLPHFLSSFHSDFGGLYFMGLDGKCYPSLFSILLIFLCIKTNENLNLSLTFLPFSFPYFSSSLKSPKQTNHWIQKGQDHNRENLA